MTQNWGWKLQGFETKMDAQACNVSYTVERTQTITEKCPYIGDFLHCVTLNLRHRKIEIFPNRKSHWKWTVVKTTYSGTVKIHFYVFLFFFTFMNCQGLQELSKTSLTKKVNLCLFMILFQRKNTFRLVFKHFLRNWNFIRPLISHLLK